MGCGPSVSSCVQVFRFIHFFPSVYFLSDLVVIATVFMHKSCTEWSLSELHKRVTLVLPASLAPQHFFFLLKLDSKNGTEDKTGSAGQVLVPLRGYSQHCTRMVSSSRTVVKCLD